MADTARTSSSILSLFADNTSGDISAQDLRDFVKSLVFPVGQISYFNTTGTAITIAAQSDGSTNLVLVNPTTSLWGSEVEMDSPSNVGRLRYTGSLTRNFLVTVTGSFLPATGNDAFVFAIAKGGTAQAASKQLVFTDATTDTVPFSTSALVSLATNEYVELYVGNMTAGRNMTINALSIRAVGLWG